MSFKARDIAGQRFGLWLAKEHVGGSKWLCRCDCGCELAIKLHKLVRGVAIGCRSCFNRNKIHGQNKTRIYSIWSGMKTRCMNPRGMAYHRYGGRGISICDAWKDSFVAFRDWALANGYRDDLSIDRFPDKNGHYEPSNCRWATPTEQSRNQTSNRLLEAFGETKTLAEWAEQYSINPGTLATRLDKKKWSVERALSSPLMKRHTDKTYADGRSSPNARLPDEHVLEIRSLYATGLFTQRQLAGRFSTSRRSIQRVVNNEAYMHVFVDLRECA